MVWKPPKSSNCLFIFHVWLKNNPLFDVELFFYLWHWIAPMGDSMTFSAWPHDFTRCVDQISENPCHATFKTGLVFTVAITKKRSLCWKKIVLNFLLDWYDFIPMVGFPLCLQRACSMPAACTAGFKFIIGYNSPNVKKGKKGNFQNPEIFPTWLCVLI